MNTLLSACFRRILVMFTERFDCALLVCLMWVRLLEKGDTMDYYGSIRV